MAVFLKKKKTEGFVTEALNLFTGEESSAYVNNNIIPNCISTGQVVRVLNTLPPNQSQAYMGLLNSFNLCLVPQVDLLTSLLGCVRI